MPLTLIVRMNPEDEALLDLGGFHSSDKLRAEVASFCRKHNIPDADEFVCVSVCLDSKKPSSYTYGYGELEVQLKQSVAQKISVACHGDFQTEAVNGGKKSTEDLQKKYAEKFLDLTKIPSVQKEESLESFIHRAPPVCYVEARIFGRITRDDVEKVNDQSFFGCLR